MALILLDAYPFGQVLVNTDKIIQARPVDGGLIIALDDGNEVKVPHRSVRNLLEAIEEAIATSKGKS